MGVLKREELVNELMHYALKELKMDEKDTLYFYNVLLKKFNIEKVNIVNYQSQNLNIDELTLNIKRIASDELLIEKEEVERFCCEIMGMLSLNPSIFEKVFWALYNESKEEACLFFYNYQIKNDYIKKTKIDLNEKWKAEFINNYLEITINLAKPEKDNKKTAQLVNYVSDKYPKCLLCKENIGYAGDERVAPRQNIRTVWFKLNNENWFMQYSPYQYYEQHIIVIRDEHRNMQISKETFVKLCDFVDMFDNYFIGSNTELPIVGGSILDHEHYQGGKHILPIFSAQSKYQLVDYMFQKCKIEYLDWYNSCFRISSKNKDDLIELSNKILTLWRDYENKEINIVNNKNELHNTITPIVRKIDNEYQIYLILRNNYTNSEYPEGVFHSHPEYHNIKKEAIGLIEASGLFILPSRLKKECELINEVLENKISLAELLDKNQNMKPHEKMIENILSDNSFNSNMEKIKMQINEYCKKILECTAVFKNDNEGNLQLEEFFRYLGFINTDIKYLYERISFILRGGKNE